MGILTDTRLSFPAQRGCTTLHLYMVTGNVVNEANHTLSIPARAILTALPPSPFYSFPSVSKSERVRERVREEAMKGGGEGGKEGEAVMGASKG